MIAMGVPGRRPVSGETGTGSLRIGSEKRDSSCRSLQMVVEEVAIKTMCLGNEDH